MEKRAKLEVVGLDSHRRELSTPTKSFAQLLRKKNEGKNKSDNEPIYAALGKDLDERVSTGSDRTLTRNRALLHYMATLAVSNSETDNFNYEFVQSLLDGGASINEAVDMYGQTIFHDVARSWNLDVAAFLLENGADINQQDKFGRSPLHVCAAADHSDMVEFLLHRGADIDCRSTGDGQTPLHFAAKNDAVLSLNVLLGFGAHIDSLDSRGRPPLQVAAELSRAATARILIEEGASSCLYDSNGSSAMTVLTEKLPHLALQALDQLHVSDKIRRRELFYLNLLEECRFHKETNDARTPLETAVIGRRFDVLMHPVMQRLVALKWEKYGKLGTFLDLMVNVVYAILFTVFAVETPGVGKELYLPLSTKAWRIVLGIVLILIITYMMYLQVRTTVKSREQQKSWIKWRIQQLDDDLQYCHPRWHEEKYVKDEMRLIKGLPLLSTMDAWFFFDWFIIILFLVAIALNVSYFRVNTHSVKFAYIRVMAILVILVWLRILKYLRPFPGIGTLVLILGATIGDFVNWGFFYLLLFIPFTSCFWIIFGSRAPIAVPTYSEAQRIVYTAIQMSVGEDFDLDGIVAADPVMARLLSAIYIAIMVIICLNILIAYLSNTFTSVYSKAVENTSMQRAINVLTIEKFLSKNWIEIYFRYVRENASPEFVPTSTEMTGVRQGGKNNEQFHKDFKTSKSILMERFSRRVGKGRIGAFDVLLRDVEKLKTLHNETVTDLCKIQSGLKDLGHIMFGQSSPIKGFQVKLSAKKVFQRRGTQRTRTSSSNLTSSRTPRTDSYVSKERDKPRWKHVPKESTSKEEARVGRGKSDKKEKGKIKFAGDDDEDEKEGLEETETINADPFPPSHDEKQRSSQQSSKLSKYSKPIITLTPPSDSKQDQHSPRSSPDTSRRDQQSPQRSPQSSRRDQRSPKLSPQSSRRDQRSPERRPQSSRRDQRSSEQNPQSLRREQRSHDRSPRSARRDGKSAKWDHRPSGQNSRSSSRGYEDERERQDGRELVPYPDGRDNDGFDEDYSTNFDGWEKISADSISL